MESYTDDAPLYMCSLCSNVFITEEDAEKHVCPSATGVTVIVEEEPTQSFVGDGEITSGSADVIVQSYEPEPAPSTSSVLSTLPDDSVKPITKKKKDLGVFQAFAHNLNEDDDTVDSKTGWTVEATHTLIKVYKEFMDSRMPPWPLIAQRMQEMGYNVTPLLCDRRWDVIKKRYHRVTQSLSKGKASTKMTSFPYLIPLSEVIPVKDREKEEGSDEEIQCKLRKRNCLWTQDEERYFLHLLKSRIINITAEDNKQALDAMWFEIANDMDQHGYHFSSRECIQKWKNLMKQYKKVENEYKPEAYQTVFENFYVVMEIMQWFPPEYLTNIQTIKPPKDSHGIDPSSTNEPLLPNSSLWPDEAVNKMLQELNKRKHLFNKTFSRKSIWRDICETMKTDGYTYHYSQLQGKWKSLKSKYRNGGLNGSPILSLFETLLKYVDGGSEDLDDSLPAMDTTLETLPHIKNSMRKYDKTGMPWSIPATKTLLELLYEQKEVFATTRGLKSLFDEVSIKLNEKGFRHDEEQCCSKWKTISKLYQKNKLDDEGSKKPYRRLPCQDIIRELCELRDHFKSLPQEKRKRVTEIKYKGGPLVDLNDEESDDDSSDNELEGTKHVIWNNDEVLNLIAVYKEVFLKVKRESYNGKMFWKTVYRRLKKRNCFHSYEACKRKMQKLRDQYIRKSEKGDSGYNDLEKWPFAAEMREVLILKKQYDKRDPLCHSVGSGPYSQNLQEGVIEQQITRRRETFVWEKDAAVLLMELYMERRDKFNNILEYRKKDLWEEISQCLHKSGFQYSAAACDMKYKSMLRMYRKTVQHNSKPGNVKKLCPFYSNFKELVQYTHVTSKEQKELYKNLKQKSKEILIESQKKVEADRQLRMEMEAKRKKELEEQKKVEELAKKENEKKETVVESKVPVKMITLPTTVLDESDLANGSIGGPDSIISATFNAETGETRIDSEVMTKMPAEHPLAQSVEVNDTVVISDIDDSDLDSSDVDVMDYALSDLDDDNDDDDDDDDEDDADIEMNDEETALVSSLSRSHDHTFSSSKLSTPTSEHSPPLKRRKTSDAKNLSTPHLTSDQTVGEVFSLLKDYEQKQEQRDLQMMNRMEQMQKTTLDVMKTLSSLIDS